MAKAGIVFLLCLTILSGCAQFDSFDGVADKKEIPVSAVASAAVINVPAVPSVTEAPTAAPTHLMPDDIRRWQVRLREVGFDPGPVDGVAGAKTQAAFKRFQSGCVQVQESLSATAMMAQSRKSASRQETLMLQVQLRDAGFNPGPVDGIFGSRTKAVLAHLHNTCAATTEIAASFDRPDGGAAISAGVAAMAEWPSATRSLAAPGRVEAVKQLAAPVALRPQEDIRILQLRLRDAGFDPGPFDGVMGPKTRLAMQQLQESQRSGKVKSSLALGSNGQY